MDRSKHSFARKQKKQKLLEGTENKAQTSLALSARNRLPWLRIVGEALPPMAYISQFM
jgi:hypothetical protein